MQYGYLQARLKLWPEDTASSALARLSVSIRAEVFHDTLQFPLFLLAQRAQRLFLGLGQGSLLVFALSLSRSSSGSDFIDSNDYSIVA
jgi:hypothetical protein